jgi:hypothetical protein
MSPRAWRLAFLISGTLWVVIWLTILIIVVVQW